MQPNYENLYRLEDPLANQPIRLEPYNDEWLDRAAAIRLLRGELLPQKPLQLRTVKGGRFTDLLWSTFTPILVISQRLVDLLSAHGFNGWSTYDVEVRDKEGQIRVNYHGLAITGKAGGHDLRRVEAIEKPPITPKGNSYIVLKGIFFKRDVWDGNDFCLMDQNTSCIVTEKVVQAFQRAKIRNVRFTVVTQVEIPASAYEVLGLWPLKDLPQ